jgi:ankyrin repeat protein
VQIVELLLLHRLTSINAVDSNGFTPLHAAAHQKHLRVCETLLHKGANPNAVNADGVPVMHLLVRIHFTPELQNVLQLALQMVLASYLLLV